MDNIERLGLIKLEIDHSRPWLWLSLSVCTLGLGTWPCLDKQRRHLSGERRRWRWVRDRLKKSFEQSALPDSPRTPQLRIPTDQTSTPVENVTTPVMEAASPIPLAGFPIVLFTQCMNNGWPSCRNFKHNADFDATPHLIQPLASTTFGGLVLANPPVFS